ncbi:MAG: AI-2E family transporter, partial [Saccharothrix sp.]|nr:AI-2E family transporter [Saccharothrix sp.]
MLLGTAAAVVVGAGITALSWLIGPVFLALTLVIGVSPVHSW